MTALLVGVSLIAVLMFVHFSAARSPLSNERPLDVERGLPAPWASHASSVFSLTALFGAYFVIGLLLGLPSLIGLAIGSVLGLWFINRWISNAQQSFESFLATRRPADLPFGSQLLWFLLIATQLGYACSELILLREIAITGLALSLRHATIFAVCVALVGYFYCLRGGYRAIFTTDLVQFLFMTVMCIVVGGYGLVHIQSWQDAMAAFASPQTATDFWSFGPATKSWLRYAVQPLLAMVMGASFILASPDTWKRVSVAQKRYDRHGVTRLALSGLFPFALVLPLLVSATERPLDRDSPPIMLFSAGTGPLTTALITLGMAASFLSSFDSALVVAAHTSLARRRQENSNLLSNYQLTLALFFSAVFFAALSLSVAVGNAYLLANLLIGPYAVIGGLVLATRGLRIPTRGDGIAWGVLAILVVWTFYVLNQPSVLARPSFEQINTVPVGVGIFVLTFIAGKMFSGGR